MPLLQFMMDSAINPVAVKSLMRAVGLPVGPLRRPHQSLPPADLARELEMVRLLGLDRR